MAQYEPPPISLNLTCFSPTRPVGKGDPMAEFAELIVLALFRTSFLREHGGIVLSQLEFLTVRTLYPAVNAFLDAMANDFTNVFSASSKRAAARAGDLSKLRPGGFRKPDMIGISPPGPDGILVELVEVTTVGEAGSTLVEDLGAKLDTLNNFVLPILQLELEDSLSQSVVPITVRASKWRPRPGQLVWPVPLAQASNRIEWICLKPTFRQSPPLGVDGLVLYEVHSVPLPAPVPQDVLDRLKEEMRRRQSQPAFLLQPSLAQYWEANPADREALVAAAAVLGVALVAALVILFLPEEALAGLAVGTARGLSLAVGYLPQALEAASGVLQSVLRAPLLGL